MKKVGKPKDYCISDYITRFNLLACLQYTYTNRVFFQLYTRFHRSNQIKL